MMHLFIEILCRRAKELTEPKCRICVLYLEFVYVFFELIVMRASDNMLTDFLCFLWVLR